MALSASAIFEIKSTATASNVNGGGFNPTNANMPTDLTTDANTANTNSPIVSSATYTFIAGDVGAQLYVKSGTNWTPGWYPIASVAGGKATLSASIGQAIQTINNRFITNTVAGCATVGTPTGGAFAVDYSQQDAAEISPTDLASVGSSTNLTSVSALFTPVMVGNTIHITTTGVGGFGVVGWYEIVSYTNTTTVVTDRTTNSGTAMVGVTGNMGGAISLGAANDDAVFELGVSSATAATRYFVKGGSNITYTLGGTVSISVNGNNAWPFILEGYATTRGDRPPGATRPRFDCGANNFTTGNTWILFNMQAIGSSTQVIDNNTNTAQYFCKIINTSTTAGRASTRFNGGSQRAIGCEYVSYRGIGAQGTSGCEFIGCYAHDSDVGLANTTGGGGRFISCIMAGCVTTALSNGGGSTDSAIYGNTLYGTQLKTGVGIATSSGSFTDIRSNIIYGFATGISSGTQTNVITDYNDYFNNTADVTSAAAVQKGANDMAVDPQFVSAAEYTGTNASTSGSVLTDGGASFGTLVPNQDFLFVTGGGTTAGIYGIVSNTGTTVTVDIALGTHASGVTYRIGYARNFAIGTNLKADGWPSLFTGGLTTSYVDIGGVQRQESGGGGSSGASYTF